MERKTQALAFVGTVLNPTDLLLASVRSASAVHQVGSDPHSCLMKDRVFLEIKKLSAFYEVDSCRL